MTGTPSSCVNCNTTGLPLLPVRYAVVPAHIKPTLPAGISAERVKDIALDSKQYQYGLRALRGGFMYLFYEKGPRGKNYWEAMSVSHDGRLLTVITAPEPPATIACANINHSVPRTAYVCIESPEKCGKVWVAFSQIIWSNETVKQYETDASLRAKRMQLIEPAQWINAPQNPHAVEATQANLEHVLEYKPGQTQGALSPFKPGEVSKEDGQHFPWKLEKQSSLYPATMRNATADDKGRPITTPESKQTVKLMHHSGKRPDGGSHPPMLLALWDGIGITHELNGYRNEAAGRIKQYGDERELEITALAAIEGMKKALADKAEARVETMEQITRDPHMLDPDFLRKNARLPQPQQALRLDDISYIEQWNAQEVPPAYGRRMNSLIGLYARNGWQDPKSLPAMLAQRDQERNLIINEVNAYLKTRDPNKKAAIADARKQSWPKYEKKLNLAAYTTFKDNYSKFLTDADKLIDQRTVELIKWLEAPLFVDTLEDFHGSNLRDGVLFEDVVGDAIFAMGSSPSGVKKLEAWAKEAQAGKKTNIIWRAVVLNQKDAITEVDKALAYAKANQTPLTTVVVGALYDNLKALQRTADVYKKAQTLYNQNERALAASAINASATDIQRGTAFGHRLKPVNTRGIDKNIITAGDAIYRAFRIDKLGDLVSEKVIQHIFSIRAFVDPEDSLNLIKAQAAEQKAANRKMRRLMQQQTQQRINLAGQFLARDTPEIREQQATALGQAWSKFKPSEAGMRAFKDARLSLVVGLIEGANFAKLWHESEGDLKTRAKIAASAISIMSAVADIASAPARTLWGDEAVSFQKIKLIGGTLGGVASVIGAGVDLDSAMKAKTKDQWGIAALFFAKSSAGATTGLLAFAATFTYSAGILEKMAGRAVGQAAYKFGKRAGAVIAFRVMMLSVGLWLTIGLIVLEVLVWTFSDNDLEEWCEKCIFGKYPDQNMHTKKAVPQMETFAKAIQEVT